MKILDIVFNLVVDDNRVAELTTAYDKSFGYKANDIGEASFSINLIGLSSNILDNLKTGSDLWISKTGFDDFGNFFNDIIWAGKLYVGNRQSAKDTGTIVSCKAFEYSNELRYRSVTKSYINTLEGDILFDLINTTQTDTTINGTVAPGILNTSQLDLGFSKGVVDPNLTLRDRIYDKDEIFKSFQQMSEVINGGDFVFYPNLKNSSPFSTTQNLRIFNYFQAAGEQTNVKYDAEIASVDIEFVNEIYNYIQFYGTNVQAIAFDAESIATYGFKIKTETNTDISVQSTAQEKANGLLSIFKQPATLYKVNIATTLNDPRFGMFDVFDAIRLVYKSDGIDLNQFIVIREIEINLDQNKMLTMNLLLSNDKIPLIKSLNAERVIAYTLRQNSLNINGIAKP
jgi:hypothetical protein